MDCLLSMTVTCLALSLALASANPITIYTSEPIKLEQIPVKKEPEPKTTEAPIHAFIHAYLTKPEVKPEVKKKPEPVESLPPLYTLYSPYYGLFAVRPMPMPVVHTPQPFLFKMKMFYHLFG